MVDLPFDLVSACSKRIEKVMNPRIAFSYYVSTKLPFHYNRVPAAIRNRLLRTRSVDPDLSRHFANEKARMILVESFRKLGFVLLRKNPPSLHVTHDIETEEGLRKALSLKAVEEELGIESTWFLPSHEYRISKSVATDLSRGGMIGSHDIKHDGKLIHLRKRAELVKRLRASRVKLEEIFEQDVNCFRSPLLQFSRRIISALNEAGYRLDFSIPCWEPVHPVTMCGFGIESAQPFEAEGVVEIPLTLFQDHQVFNLMRLNFRDAVKLWIDQAKLIRSLDADLVLLVHPDYSFSRDLRAYKELLERLLQIVSSNRYRSEDSSQSGKVQQMNRDGRQLLTRQSVDTDQPFSCRSTQEF